MPYWIYNLGSGNGLLCNPETFRNNKDEAIAYVEKMGRLAAFAGVHPCHYKICYGKEEVFTTLKPNL